MEDVLDVYCRPYDEHEPLVCLDVNARVNLGSDSVRE
jgi:hypothetical protein